MDLVAHFMLYLKVHLRFSVIKSAQEGEGKDASDVVVDGLLKSTIEGAPKNASKDALNDLWKHAKEATMKFESKQNIVNILNFQLLLVIFNPFDDTFHYQKSLGLKEDKSKMQCSASRVSRTCLLVCFCIWSTTITVLKG